MAKIIEEGKKYYTYSQGQLRAFIATKVIYTFRKFSKAKAYSCTTAFIHAVFPNGWRDIISLDEFGNSSKVFTSLKNYYDYANGKDVETVSVDRSLNYLQLQKRMIQEYGAEVAPWNHYLRVYYWSEQDGRAESTTLAPEYIDERINYGGQECFLMYHPATDRLILPPLKKGFYYTLQECKDDNKVKVIDFPTTRSRRRKTTA